MMKDLGWEVTGSDQGAYPPMTDYLEKNGIQYFKEYKAEHISKEMDLVVVGGNTLHVDKENEEFEEAKKLGIELKTWPELVQEHLIKPESIVITGTYGKTTISALLTKIFVEAGLDPSFMIGEVSEDFPDNVKSTGGKYSIVEGDEHPTHKGFVDQAKFHFYNPKYLLITSAMWDHFDIYTTEEAYVRTYTEIIKKLPKDGFLVLAKGGINTARLALASPCEVFWYEPFNPEAAYKIGNISTGEGKTQLQILEAGEEYVVETALFGKHNWENVFAAIAMARLLGVGVEAIQEAMKEFKGLKKHLELKFQNEKVEIYHDLGQHPAKAKGAVEATKERFPKKKLVVVLDTQASVLHDVNSLQWYGEAYAKADLVLVAPLKHRSKGEGEDRVTGSMIVKAIAEGGGKAKYLPDIEKLEQAIEEEVKDKVVVLFLSTGNFGGLIERVVDHFKNIG